MTYTSTRSLKRPPKRLFAGNLSLSLSLSLLLSVSLWGCEGSPDQKKPQDKPRGETQSGSKEKKEERPTPVEATRVTRGDVSQAVRAIAVVEAKEQATVRALTSGLLTTLKVDEGARVREGQLLAQLTRPGASALLQKAYEAHNKAKKDEARLKDLSDRGLSPVEEWRQAKFQAQQSALELMRLRQESKHERVTSPLRGVITRRSINRGEQVSLGQALFEVMDLSALRVPLHIPDRWASQLKEGLKVRLFDRAERLITDEARVSLVSPVVDAQSGTIKVFVSPPPKLKALKPGLFVSAEVILDTAQDTLTLPKHALLYRDDEPWVVLANGDVARLVKLTLGYTQGERVEVRSPLKEGDLVVSFGQRGLEEGAKLKVSERP